MGVYKTSWWCGQAQEGAYRARLYFTDDIPMSPTEPYVDGERSGGDVHEIRTAQYLEVSVGESMTLEQEVFEENFDYAPCFTWVVWDPAGHKAQAAKCLPVMSPSDVRTLASLSPDPLSTDVGRSESPAASAAGCSVVARRRSTSDPSPLGFVGLLLGLSLRRRSGRHRD